VTTSHARSHSPWHRLHHEAAKHARSANAAAGQAARLALVGNHRAAAGARALSAWHRSLISRGARLAQQRAMNATIAAIAGDDLEPREVSA
jgi:RecB family exonuclease